MRKSSLYIVEVIFSMLWTDKHTAKFGWLYLSGSTRLDVSLSDHFCASLQAEFVGRLSVLLTGRVELQVFLTELGSQERLKHCDSHWRTGEKRKNLNELSGGKKLLFLVTNGGGRGWDDAFTSMFCHTPTHIIYNTQERKKALYIDILRVYLTPHTFLPSDFLKTLKLRVATLWREKIEAGRGAGLWSYNILLFPHFNQSRHQHTPTTHFTKDSNVKSNAV